MPYTNKPALLLCLIAGGAGAEKSHLLVQINKTLVAISQFVVKLGHLNRDKIISEDISNCRGRRSNSPYLALKQSRLSYGNRQTHIHHQTSFPSCHCSLPNTNSSKSPRVQPQYIKANYSVYFQCWKGQFHPLAHDSQNTPQTSCCVCTEQFVCTEST